jgi:hypothetical protein
MEVPVWVPYGISKQFRKGSSAKFACFGFSEVRQYAMRRGLLAGIIFSWVKRRSEETSG